jgi:hypothetical protein
MKKSHLENILEDHIQRGCNKWPNMLQSEDIDTYPRGAGFQGQILSHLKYCQF